MSEKKPSFRSPRICLSALLAAPLVVLSGCGLLGSNKKPNIEETPPYYQAGSYVNVPMDHDFMSRDDPTGKSSVSSREELALLQSEAEAFARSENRKAEKESGEKKSVWNWFRSGDRMTGMSSEAKEINRSLDAKRGSDWLER